MVEKMKKYSFLIYHKTYDEFLENLQQAGVVHVVEKQKGVPDEATDLRKQLATANLLKNTVRTLEQRLEALAAPSTKEKEPEDGMNALAEFERLKSQDEQLKSQQQILQKEIELMSVWGNFDPEMLKKLEQSGRKLKFYSCRERDFNPEWIDKFNAVEVSRVGAFVYFVTVTSVDFDEEPEAEKTRISDKSLNDLQAALQENNRQVVEIWKQFDTLAIEQLSNLKETQRKLLENIDLNKVHLQVEKKAGDSLLLLEGWVPEIKEKDLVETLNRHDVYYFGVSPEKDDNSAPILLKNNKFSRLFEPIGELYELPNYHELDLTPFFAPFYMLFFGLCLGDAGYGLLILFAALYARKKMKPSLKPIFSLAAVLGAITIFCGMLGGTLFGIPLADTEWAWLTSLKAFMIDSDQLFNLALILGGVQIIFAMFVKAFGAIRRYGFMYSLETWGWLVLLLGLGGTYFAFGGEMFAVAPVLCYTILGVAFLFIFILNTPGRNPLINFGAGVWNTYNMVTGLLGDLLSYIRLFALGICSGVMGFVFNDLAMQLSPDLPVVGHIVMLVILLAGHSLNIFMSALGSFVHPMRLTFVEFYKNAGFEGGGKKYKPLQLIES